MRFHFGPISPYLDIGKFIRPWDQSIDIISIQFIYDFIMLGHERPSLFVLAKTDEP